MTDWFLSGGFIMWPLLALALGIIALTVRAAITLRRLGTTPADADGLRRADPAAARRVLVPILFWGGIALLIGALGTVVGIIIIAQNVSTAGGASAGLVWGGVGVALVSLAFGILVFLLSGFIWLVLDTWRRRLLEPSGSGALAG